jgi:type II secretory pathway pseudopilin PulG
MGIIKNFKHLQSFTIIETIVVIGVFGLALPALFTIVFTILQQQTKIIRLSEVKRQGDFILNVIENTVRNYALSVYSEQSLSNIQCATAGSSYIYPTNGSLYFKDRFGNWFRFYTLTAGGVNYVASEGAKVSSINLTTNKVQVNNLTISCTRSARYSPPIVTVSFATQYNTTSTRPEETASLNYQTKIKLRSY